MKLKQITIQKFKCIENDQTFDVQDDITILVGMNESGKTSILQAIAKTNYFQEDKDFKFDLVPDYPRKEKKSVDKSIKNGDEYPNAVTCVYELEEDDINRIEKECGKGIIIRRVVAKTVKYNNTCTIQPIKIDLKKFLTFRLKGLDIYSETLIQKLEKISSQDELTSLIENDYKDEKIIVALKKLEIYYENKCKWSNPIDEYIDRIFIAPYYPKFLYYDEYYTLPSRIKIEDIKNNPNPVDEETKTAKALIELADINLDELVQSKDFESYKTELEATQANISEILFKYWKTNKNLSIVFDIDKKESNDARRIIEHILDIRVCNKGVTLPLKNRSKGFNWFFSFLVWFKKIQEDSNSKYILLLDEPGLNLHASAQKDLLAFIEDLSKDYQIIYTTHSPFMIPSEQLKRVRTVLETDNGSIISDSIQEKDPNTLFPLQAALGYDIAQNLFISPKNLLVEGVSDLIYLQIMSNILKSMGKEGLSDDITIIPVGGLDKVATFISLLRGQELQIACLLDTFTDAKGKAKLKDLVIGKIIQENKIRFFDEFMDGYTHADIEDMFSKNDYLKIYNNVFSSKIKLSDLNADIKSIIIQINKYSKTDRFNHYIPANKLAQMGVDNTYFEKETIDNFEKVFKAVNKLLQ